MESWAAGWDYGTEVSALNTPQMQQPGWLQAQAFPGAEWVPVFTHTVQVLFQWVHLFQDHIPFIPFSQHPQLPNVLQALKKKNHLTHLPTV